MGIMIRMESVHYVHAERFKLVQAILKHVNPVIIRIEDQAPATAHPTRKHHQQKKQRHTPSTSNHAPPPATAPAACQASTGTPTGRRAWTAPTATIIATFPARQRVWIVGTWHPARKWSVVSADLVQHVFVNVDFIEQKIPTLALACHANPVEQLWTQGQTHKHHVDAKKVTRSTTQQIHLPQIAQSVIKESTNPTLAMMKSVQLVTDLKRRAQRVPRQSRSVNAWKVMNLTPISMDAPLVLLESLRPPLATNLVHNVTGAKRVRLPPDAVVRLKVCAKNAQTTHVPMTKPVTTAGFVTITKRTRRFCETPTRPSYRMKLGHSTPRWISVARVAVTLRGTTSMNNVTTAQPEQPAGMGPGFATTRSHQPTSTTLTPQINAGHATNVQLASTKTNPVEVPV